MRKVQISQKVSRKDSANTTALPDQKNSWIAMRKPTEYTERADLPKKAGVYMVFACSANGKQIEVSPDAPKGLRGLLYVGMTGKSNTLRVRFWQLVRSWSGNFSGKPPHDSRAHYDSDPILSAKVALTDIRLTYMPLESVSKTSGSELIQFLTGSGKFTAAQVREVFPILFPSRDENVFTTEASFIQWYRRKTGFLPPLNRDNDGGKDPFMSNVQMDGHLDSLEILGEREIPEYTSVSMLGLDGTIRTMEASEEDITDEVKAFTEDD